MKFINQNEVYKSGQTLLIGMKFINHDKLYGV
jgi:hypothetical protein